MHYEEDEVDITVVVLALKFSIKVKTEALDDEVLVVLLNGINESQFDD